MQSVQDMERVGATFAIGLLLIVAGVSSLLERAHLLEQVSVSEWWPLLLLVIGFAKLAGQPRERRRGWIYLGIGTWCLIVVRTSLTFSDTWPLLLMFWGASIVWCGLADGDHALPAVREGSHAS